MWFLLLLLGSLFDPGLATLEVLEDLGSPPAPWVRVAKPIATHSIRFTISLSEPESGALERKLYDVASPSHPNYGHHLSRTELKAMLQPNTTVSDTIISWLRKYVAAESIHDDGDLITFDAEVGVAEKLLTAEFAVYRDTESSFEITRTLRYSVPASIRRYVDTIQPTTRFYDLRALKWHMHDTRADRVPTSAPDTDCNSTITPACLLDLYALPTQDLGNRSNGFAAFSNFLDQYPRYTDLDLFQDRYAKYASGANFSYESFNGGKNDQDSPQNSGEANLDAQYLVALSYPIPITAYSTGGRGPALDSGPDGQTAVGVEPCCKFFKGLLSKEQGLPHTLTTSYGEEEQSVPLEYRKTICKMMPQLGLRRVSVLFSSSDTGVGSTCHDRQNATRFNPTFPAGCPYVTSVGATWQINPEKAAPFSSGGFSDTWPRPAYQEHAVGNYLRILGDQWSGLFNRQGRDIPDVAAQGVAFRVIDKRQSYLSSGTSASCPTFASVVARLNQKRIADGKPPLGFLNPWLYTTALLGLNDISVGGSIGCNGLTGPPGESLYTTPQRCNADKTIA